MKSAAYWAKRFNLLEQAQHDRGAAAFSEIDRKYRAAQIAIERKIAAWYQRFADNNEISLAEAKKWLTAKELKEFQWDVHEYIRYGKENAVNGQWVKELENASARFHISRLEALKVQCQQEIEVLFGGTLDVLDQSMRDVFRSGYYRTAFEIQRGVGVGWDFATLDTKTISRVISSPWAKDGVNFSDRIWADKQKLLAELDTTLTQNIILGQDPQKAIDSISKRLGVSKNNAGRLVMTEEAYFSSEGQKECFNELDVEQFEIVATLDSITSDICRSMDGKVFKMSEWEVGVTAPPFHPWCRTTTVPYFDDEWAKEGERAARDRNGKVYYVPANMTYEQWVNNYVTSAPLDIRKPVDIQFDTNVTGYQSVIGGHTVKDAGEKFGYPLKIVTLDKRNTTDWNDLPIETQQRLRYTGAGNKPFRLEKGQYEVQRYTEGSLENAERDEIARSIGGEYIGFTFKSNKSGSYYIDFYQKGDELFYSVGKADLNKTISESALDTIEQIASERERLIMENIGKTHTANLAVRSGDEWVSAMKEFHRTIQADGKPVILSDAEYQAVNTPTLYRGIAPQSRLRSDITTTSTTREMADEFFKGASPFPSRGVYGDGVAYCSPAYKEIALNYATNGGTKPHGGVIIEFKLKPDARVISYEDSLEIFKKMSQRGGSKLLFNPRQKNAFDKEVGKAMNALGYDAILKHNGDNTGQDFYVILNRAALVTKGKYVTKAL